MLPLLLNLKLVLPSLLLLNLISIFIYRKDLRFIKGPILLFGLLMLSFLIYRFLISPGQSDKVQASRQTEIKNQGWDYLNNPKMDNEFQKQEISIKKTSLLLFRLMGLQAAFSFIFSCIGIFISADKKVYAGFALGFFILAFIFLT